MYVKRKFLNGVIVSLRELMNRYTNQKNKNMIEDINLLLKWEMTAIQNRKQEEKTKIQNYQWEDES